MSCMQESSTDVNDVRTGTIMPLLIIHPMVSRRGSKDVVHQLDSTRLLDNVNASYERKGHHEFTNLWCPFTSCKVSNYGWAWAKRTGLASSTEAVVSTWYILQTQASASAHACGSHFLKCSLMCQISSKLWSTTFWWSMQEEESWLLTQWRIILHRAGLPAHQCWHQGQKIQLALHRWNHVLSTPDTIILLSAARGISYYTGILPDQLCSLQGQ